MTQWGHSFFSLLSYCWASKALGLPNISSAIKALYSCSKGAQHFSVSSTPKDVQTVYQGWYLMNIYSDNWTKRFKIEQLLSALLTAIRYSVVATTSRISQDTSFRLFFFNLPKLLGMQPIFEQLSKLHPSYFNMLKIPKLKSMLNNLVKKLVYKNRNANLSRFLTPLWDSSQTTLGFLQPKHPHWDSARKNVFVR